MKRQKRGFNMVSEFEKYWVENNFLAGPNIGIVCQGYWANIFGDYYYIRYHGQTYRFCGYTKGTENISYNGAYYEKITIAEDPDARDAIELEIIS